MSNYVALEDTTVTLNNTVLTGFSDDTDALGLPTELEIAAVKRGADGRMTATSTGNKGGPIVFKMLPTSLSVPFLSSLAEQQKNGSRVVFAGSIVNHQTGASASLVNGTLTSYPPFPAIGKGEVSNMNYTIEFERIDGNFTSANFS